MGFSIEMPLAELHRHGVARLSATMAAKLANAVAANSPDHTAENVTVRDLLDNFPARYEDRSNLISIDSLSDGTEAAVEIVIRNSGGTRVGRNRDPRRPPLFIFEITGGDAGRRSRPVTIKWFVSGKNGKKIVEYYAEKFKRGTRFMAYGLWQFDERRGVYFLKLAKPEELEILPTDETGLFTDQAATSEDGELAEDTASPEFATIHTARTVPVYRKLGPFLTKRLREIIYDVLQKLDAASVKEELPADLIERHSLITRRQALKEIHFPPDNVPVSDYDMCRSPAQRRLIFDEFFWLSFSMQLLRGERRAEPKASVIEVNDSIRTRLKELIPFRLTNAQKKVIGEIFADLRSDAPMNRLVQGDVGSGKTIVAFLAMYAEMENGYQTALMAPTEILAEQHFRNASRLFAESGHRIALLTGSTKAAEKRKLHAALADGTVDMVIGTHALIQDTVAFERLGLVVIDEQHRFGVLQRARPAPAGRVPDMLVMTATPIPRSLAMTVYGDLDVSIIDELPPGRTAIRTVVVGEDKREGVYRGIKREVELGRQAYVVYPLIEESERSDLKAAKAMYEHLKDDVFPQFTVGLLHGKMKGSEKDAIMAEFIAGRINILVSTTVIEVGVDVPNASLMVVEHAERFGLSQLHQLRGRVGRGSEQSYCVLLADFKRTAVAKERLGIMEQTNDGFKIAERDLEIRGQGELLGTRQSGMQSFRLANIIRDLDILTAARAEAECYLIEKRSSPETSEMVKIARSNKNARFGIIA
ncbi:MAG: ATP-dependent DNA helicase RecG [Pyrinomonadaceae bacterium]|nr:ATP-dependent DNA helicase RecG [Pyrinomonadaceae bacterium]